MRCAPDCFEPDPLPQVASRARDAAVIEHALNPLVLGANPLDTETLWHRTCRHTRDDGRKRSVVAAVSAVCTALSDVEGKAHGVPTYQLVGGALRTSAAGLFGGCSAGVEASAASGVTAGSLAGAGACSAIMRVYGARICTNCP